MEQEIIVECVEAPISSHDHSIEEAYRDIRNILDERKKKNLSSNKDSFSFVRLFFKECEMLFFG